MRGEDDILYLQSCAGSNRLVGWTNAGPTLGELGDNST